MSAADTTVAEIVSDAEQHRALEARLETQENLWDTRQETV